MKKEYLLLNVIFLCLLFFQGCTGLIVSRADAPEEIIMREAKTVKATEPYEVDQKLLPARMDLISSIPQGEYKKLKLGGNPVGPVSKNTVKKLQDEARESKSVIFINREKMIIETQGGNGKWYRGWVEPETVFLAKANYDASTGITEYELYKLGICWNPVRNVKVRQLPVILKITERYRDTTKQIIEQRYRDTDYTPALWAGLGGLAVGGVLGWILHPAATTTVITKTLGCIGGPAPLPLVP
ncbi:MAG TPA: hypothetical protein P5089_02600 [Candidatus Portnoybacteria bacterium]|nr:hypothetical protein [Candidatus Portnoybacteria bacterium]